MLIRSILKISFDNENVAELIYKSIIPDNKQVPERLTIKTEVRGADIVIEIVSPSPMTIKNTIDEIIMCIMTAIRVVSSVAY
ncbi:MAG: hypothetical protein DRJ49_02475 [Thermoprotei archaeon]|nr:MAG: hypothetical protein DRJ49_02475 [Thermoprotei archaeon]